MTAADLRDQDLLEQALALVMHAHRDIPRHLRGPALTFWVFHVVRDYAATLDEGRSRHRPILPDLLSEAEALERAVGRIEMVFGHNDLLPGNFHYRYRVQAHRVRTVGGARSPPGSRCCPGRTGRWPA